jgi:subtilisin family serine protease
VRAAAPPEPRVEVERLSANQVRDLARDPSVAAVAPVMPTQLVKPFEVAASAAPTTAWGIAAVKADESPFMGAGVTVAVLDTGIDRSHEAFQGVTIVEEDFSGSGNGDRQGHGTHCAGTIVGRDVSGTRIGIARGVNHLLIGKVLGDNGGGDSEMIFRGIQWSLQQNADVISMSLGFDFPGFVQDLVDQGWPADLATSVALEAYRGNLRMFDALMEMVEARAAFGQGTILVAAAGNESQRDKNPEHEIAVSIPAAAQGVVSVGALQAGQDGLQIAPFSNTFPQVSAPGVGVLSARLGGGLKALNGTSMATPHVAGITALWWEALRNSPVNANGAAVLARLLASARTGGFVQDVDPSDRGLGIVTAPLA